MAKSVILRLRRLSAEESKAVEEGGGKLLGLKNPEKKMSFFAVWNPFHQNTVLSLMEKLRDMQSDKQLSLYFAIEE